MNKYKVRYALANSEDFQRTVIFAKDEADVKDIFSDSIVYEVEQVAAEIENDIAWLDVRVQADVEAMVDHTFDPRTPAEREHDEAGADLARTQHDAQ